MPTVSALFVYPVKSMRGIARAQVLLAATVSVGNQSPHANAPAYSTKKTLFDFPMIEPKDQNIDTLLRPV